MTQDLCAKSHTYGICLKTHRGVQLKKRILVLDILLAVTFFSGGFMLAGALVSGVYKPHLEQCLNLTQGAA